jgi:hypothetical protein
MPGLWAEMENNGFRFNGDRVCGCEQGRLVGRVGGDIVNGGGVEKYLNKLCF